MNSGQGVADTVRPYHSFISLANFMNNIGLCLSMYVKTKILCFISLLYPYAAGTVPGPIVAI